MMNYTNEIDIEQMIYPHDITGCSFLMSRQIIDISKQLCNYIYSIDK